MLPLSSAKQRFSFIIIYLFMYLFVFLKHESLSSFDSCCLELINYNEIGNYLGDLTALRVHSTFITDDFHRISLDF